jgi:hypothetical protein
MFRRRIFYLSGFDPRGARFYHAMHREQIAAHAAKTGEDIAVSARTRGAGDTVDWTVENRSGQVLTRCSFLRWDDLVARAWVKGPLHLGWKTACAYGGYARHHDWKSYWRLGKGPFVTTIYPLLAITLLPLLMALPLAALAAIVFPVWLASVITLVAGIALSRPLIGKIRAFWLIRLFIQNHAVARDGFDQDTLARLDSLAESVAAALVGDEDEVLLVAHSNGSIMAVPLLLRLIARHGRALPEKFTLVTLGHCIPLLSCRRDAAAFHAMERELAGHAFNWIDIGSPPDGAAFNMVEPLAPASDHGAIRLTLLTPRFYKFYNPETYHAGFANKYEIHFDYLRSGDRVSPIDFPSLTASPHPIAEAVATFRMLA